MFDRLYRAATARRLPGSGLGLAIVRQVAEAHGGEVSAERAEDGGTRMHLRSSRVRGRPSSGTIRGAIRVRTPGVGELPAW